MDVAAVAAAVVIGDAACADGGRVAETGNSDT